MNRKASRKLGEKALTKFYSEATARLLEMHSEVEEGILTQASYERKARALYAKLKRASRRQRG